MTETAKPDISIVEAEDLYIDSIICEVGETVADAPARHGYTADDKVIVIVLVAPDPNRFPEPSIAANNVISLSEVSRARKAGMRP